MSAAHRFTGSRRSSIKTDEQGFTLIELLVVVLIIGILAAIAIPAFLGQQNQAKDAAAKSDIGAAKLALVSYQTSNNGLTTGIDADKLKANGYSKTAGTGVFTIKTMTGGFCIQEISQTNATYSITDTGGVASAPCVAGYTTTLLTIP